MPLGYFGVVALFTINNFFAIRRIRSFDFFSAFGAFAVPQFKGRALGKSGVVSAI